MPDQVAKPLKRADMVLKNPYKVLKNNIWKKSGNPVGQIYKNAVFIQSVPAAILQLFYDWY